MFLMIFQDQNEFDEYKLIKQEWEEKSKIIEPYVVVIGDLCQDSTPDLKTFIALGSCVYPVESNSILDAVEKCLKCMIALHIEYPAPAGLIWYFLHKHFFCISTSDKRKSTTVSKLIDHLNGL